VQATISGYETGTREPPLPVLLRYSNVSGVWVNSIIDDGMDIPERLPCQRMSEGVPRQLSVRMKDKK
jgi:hypothetical protein